MQQDIPSVPPQTTETFNEIDLVGATAGTITLTDRVVGDPLAQPRFSLTAGGTMSWGPGGGAIDVSIQRTGAGLLQLGGPGHVWDNTNSILKLSGSTTQGAIQLLSQGNPFSVHVASATFNGQRDDVLFYAYNLTPGTTNTRVNTSEPLWKIGLENHDFSDGVNHHVELNLDYLSVDGLTTRRPLAINVDRTTHVPVLTFLGTPISFANSAGAVQCNFDFSATQPKLTTSTSVNALYIDGLLGINGPIVATGYSLNINGQSTGGGGFTSQYATAGTQHICQIYHTNNSNGSSHSNLEIRTGGGSGGDPYATFVVNGVTAWYLGCDNSDSDSFVLSATGIGTSNLLKATTAGAFTLGGSATLGLLNDSATLSMGASSDVVLARDTAAVFAIKNSTTAQTLRIYGTTAGPKYVYLSHDGSEGLLVSQSGPLYFGAANNTDWLINASHHFMPNANGTLDLGGTSNKMRNVFVGGGLMIFTKAGAVSDADFTNPADGMIGYDTTGLQLYIRVGGTWKKSAAFT